MESGFPYTASENLSFDVQVEKIPGNGANNKMAVSRTKDSKSY
jgi:hypothetical protein